MEESCSVPHIVIATPCFGGMVTQGYMMSILQLMQLAGPNSFQLNIALLGSDALITRSRAVLVSNFLAVRGATHLLFIDADIAFEPEQVLRLLRADKDFAVALYPIKSIDWDAAPGRLMNGETLASAGLSYVGTLLDEPERVTDGDFATAYYAGTGFQLIRRSVFERLIAAHPELHFTTVHTQARSRPANHNLCALFDPLIEPDTGIYLSEDFAFCHRWRAIGGNIWLDTKSQLTHIGPDHFRGNTANRYAAAA